MLQVTTVEKMDRVEFLLAMVELLNFMAVMGLWWGITQNLSQVKIQKFALKIEDAV